MTTALGLADNRFHFRMRTGDTKQGTCNRSVVISGLQREVFPRG